MKTTHDIAAAQHAWQCSHELTLDLSYDFVFLEELNIAIRNDYLKIGEVEAFLKERPRNKHICIAGGDACTELNESADLV